MSENDKLEKRKRTTRNICVLVTVVFITVMLILPLFSIIVSSLKEGIGFYIKSVTSAYVLSALKVTVIATVVAVVINTLFGIIAAWVLTRFDFKGKQILATLIDIPFSISPVIVGLAFLMTFGRLGFFYPVIRWFNEVFGTNVRIAFAIPGVVLATIFVTFPYVSREIIPVLNSLGRDEEEAAALMGANGFTIFFKITLPAMSPSIFFAVVMTVISSFQVFDQTFVSTMGGPNNETNTMVLYLYNNAFKYQRLGYASAIAWVLFFCMLIITGILMKQQKRLVNYDS